MRPPRIITPDQEAEQAAEQHAARAAELDALMADNVRLGLVAAPEPPPRPRPRPRVNVVVPEVHVARNVEPPATSDLRGIVAVQRALAASGVPSSIRQETGGDGRARWELALPDDLDDAERARCLAVIQELLADHEKGRR